jgi:hypothetical protein
MAGDFASRKTALFIVSSVETSDLNISLIKKTAESAHWGTEIEPQYCHIIS